MNEVVPNLNENINKNVNKDNLFQSEELQKENWAKSKEIISKNIKQIVWKAWIEPLYYERYKDGVLYIRAESSLIANRAVTQYYETIFCESSNHFQNLKKIKINSPDKQNRVEKNINKVSLTHKPQAIFHKDLSFVDSVSMKINPSLTFDNFVVGESNRMAYAASTRIC